MLIVRPPREVLQHRFPMSHVALRTSSRGRPARDLTAFLPTTREEMHARGWDELDILIVTGDAYVDHPAFGPVLIARFLEGRGFKVGRHRAARLATTPSDLARMGAPRLFVGVTAGNLDSMLNKLTAQKKMRGEDQYSPGGAHRACGPNRATIVYANLCRAGLPRRARSSSAASRRRSAASRTTTTGRTQVRRSILLDAKADLLVFGMGERAGVGDRATPRRRARRIDAAHATCAAPRTS